MICCTNNGAVTSSDQFVVNDVVNGSKRCVSGKAISDFVAQDLNLDNGILGFSTICGQRGTSVVVPLTTTLAPINPFTSTLAFTVTGATNNSLLIDSVNGRFYATRDLSGLSVNFMLNASWTNAIDLTVAVFVTDGITPQQSDLLASSVGTGAVRAISGSGLVMNFNIPLGVIKAGQYLYLAAKLGTAGNLTISNSAFNVQTIDGA